MDKDREYVSIVGIFFRAVAAFFRDLRDGDPVAITLVIVFAAVLALFVFAGFWIMRSRKKNAEAFQKKQRKKQKADDAVFAKMKKNTKQL